jgi:hemin uptake protein HemP
LKLLNAHRDDAAPREDEHATAPSVSSGDLLRGARELVIRHGSDRYRLLLTKSNKLILVK